MIDPASPVSERTSRRRLRRVASNEGGHIKQEGDMTDTLIESTPRQFKRLRRAPSSARQTAAVQRREECIVLDDDSGLDAEDVPLALPYASSSRPATPSPRPATNNAPLSPSVGLFDGSDGDSDDDNACSICLGQPVDAAVLDSCAHSFCFVCIFRWCTDICNNCPLCKRRVSQIKHYGDAVKGHSSMGGSRQPERANTETRVKHERSSEEEKRVEEDAEDDDADGAADDWNMIQTQRTENQMRRRGRRQGGGQLSQLSLDASPSSLVEGIQAIAAMGHSDAAPLTRRKAKEKVAEQQQIISRTHSNASSPTARPSSLHSLSHSHSNAAASATSSASSSPTSTSAMTAPAAAMLVVHISDRQQRSPYEETEELPSPSILNSACELCYTDDNEHLLLLCDGCDDAYHTYCLQPRLHSIPENEWFCPNCLQEARLQAGDEQKAASEATTPRRSRHRLQRLRSLVSPAIGQRLAETPQSAEALDEDYTPGSGERFDNTPIPLSFASIRAGQAPRSTQRRRSVRQVQLNRQALERQRQQQDEQMRQRAERAVKRRQDKLTVREEDEDEYESDSDDSDHLSPSSAAAYPTASSRPGPSAPTAPPSSLHQLSSSQNETLQQRVIELRRVKAREEARERQAQQFSSSNYIEKMLDEAARQRHNEQGDTDTKGGQGSKKGKRKVHREEEEKVEPDEWGIGSGRVRRKVANHNKAAPEPIIVSTNVSSTRQPLSSFSMLSAPSVPSAQSVFPSHPSLQPAPSSATASRWPSAPVVPASSPRSSLSSLPFVMRPPQLSSVGYQRSNSSTVPAAQPHGTNGHQPHAASSARAVSTQTSHAVVPPAKFPYAPPVIQRKPAASSHPLPSFLSTASTVSTSSNWHASHNSVPPPAASASSAASSVSVPAVESFDEFERTRSSHTSRSPFHSPLSPPQQRQLKHMPASVKRHSYEVGEKAALPMRQTIF